jgi:hypothetical protein
VIQIHCLIWINLHDNKALPLLVLPICNLVVTVPGYRCRGPGFDSLRYQIFWEVVVLEWGPLSFMRIIVELFQGNGGSVALTTWHPLSAKVGTNFADKRRSLNQYGLCSSPRASWRHQKNCLGRVWRVTPLSSANWLPLIAPFRSPKVQAPKGFPWCGQQYEV